MMPDGVNHMLKNAPADRAANLATDPNLPPATGAVPAIVDFIAKAATE
jgi:hypothetical protein